MRRGARTKRVSAERTSADSRPVGQARGLSGHIERRKVNQKSGTHSRPAAQILKPNTASECNPALRLASLPEVGYPPVVHRPYSLQRTCFDHLSAGQRKNQWPPKDALPRGKAHTQDAGAGHPDPSRSPCATLHPPTHPPLRQLPRSAERPHLVVYEAHAAVIVDEDVLRVPVVLAGEQVENGSLDRLVAAGRGVRGAGC